MATRCLQHAQQPLSHQWTGSSHCSVQQLASSVWSALTAQHSSALCKLGHAGYRAFHGTAQQAYKVVVVESPAKANKIQQYLGDEYKVLATHGHFRDLSRRPGSVDPWKDFHMKWEVAKKYAKRLDAIRDVVRGAEELVLATDPDREGEAISWHILQELKKNDLRSDTKVHRITFTSVTRNAVLFAMSQPRDISSTLVEAYLARRALDYLVGYHLSPILWRKVNGAKSAGRVQSVALRLVCERQNAIESHVPVEYWTCEVDLQQPNGEVIPTRLHRVDGKAVDTRLISDSSAAQAVAQRIQTATFRVASVKEQIIERQPPSPCVTAAIQQAADVDLGLNIKLTMQKAQELYEGGHLEGDGVITYHRTDGMHIEKETIDEIRDFIEDKYGPEYLPEFPRIYAATAQNAQEAHEAIRPTNVYVDGTMIRYDKEACKLYDLIRKRTLASQMKNALIKQVSVEFVSDEGDLVLRSSSSKIEFDGFLAAYDDLRTDPSDWSDSNEEEHIPQEEEEDEDEMSKFEKEEARREARRKLVEQLLALKEGDVVRLCEVRPIQQSTKPPPFYTEGSLVRALEKLGIGRPSTYATSINLLQERSCVHRDGRKLHALLLGRVLVAFLSHYFSQMMDYDFTAKMEQQLDLVAEGKAQWQQVLSDFWLPFHDRVVHMDVVSVRNVITELNRLLGPLLIPTRQCPECKTGILTLKLGTNGYVFVGCSEYPSCTYTMLPAGQDGRSETTREAMTATGKLLGKSHDSGQPVFVKVGRYGPYVQMGDTDDAVYGGKPLRASLQKNVTIDEMTLEKALELLSVPHKIGDHPKTGKPIMKKGGKYGPYIQHEGMNVSIPKTRFGQDLTLEAALELLEQQEQKKAKKEATNSEKMQKYIEHLKAQQAVGVAAGPQYMNNVEKTTEQLGEYAQQTSSQVSPYVPMQLPTYVPRRRMLNGYMVFCTEERRRMQEAKESPKDVSKKLGAMWRELDAAQKWEYANKAAEMNAVAA